jgi:hypothetical protein
MLLYLLDGNHHYDSMASVYRFTPIMTGHISRQGNVTCYIISIYLILITLRQVGEPIVVRDSHRPAESHRQTLLLKVVSFPCREMCPVMIGVIKNNRVIDHFLDISSYTFFPTLLLKVVSSTPRHERK